MLFINFIVTAFFLGATATKVASNHRTTYSCTNGDYNLEPITSMLVIAQSTAATNTTCPSPYELINQDLNEGAGGQFVYTCITRGDPASRFGVPLTDLTVVTGSSRDAALCPADSYRIGQDLNAGGSGDYIFFCRNRFGASAITDIAFVTDDNSCPSGYEKLAQNLNSNTKSTTSIYTCVQKSCDVAIQAPTTLNHRADGSFKIAQFTDAHFGESYEADIKTATLVYHQAITTEDPDLIALTGDQVSGGPASNDGGFAESYYRVVDTILGLGYSYFYTTGNHDPEGDLNQKQIAALDVKVGGSVTLTKVGPANITGGTNYYLPVYNYQESAPSVPATSLWVFDSNQYTCNGNSSGWGCIGEDQIEWYKATAADLKTAYGGVLPPALSYFHVRTPLTAMYLYSFAYHITPTTYGISPTTSGVCR